MRGSYACAAVFLVCIGTTAADKPELKPYGFIKGDMYYVPRGRVLSWGKPALTCASVADTKDGGSGIAFTAQHTRVGLKGSSEIGAVTIGGLVETDFFWIASDANNKPRMRLAYAWCKPLKGLDIRVGQQWDIFSPLNPTTNNTNANLWYNGNYGFRRPMFQVRYGMDLGEMKPEVQLGIGEAAKDAQEEGKWLGADNISDVPMVQGRLGVGLLGKATIGFAGTYAAFGTKRYTKTMGFSLDIDAPIHDLIALRGELAAGTNLNNANLFTLGGSGDDNTEVSTTGFWVNATSKPWEFFNTTLGFAQEYTTTSVADDAVENNTTLYWLCTFPIGTFFSLSGEIQYFNAEIKNAPNETAVIIDLAGTVSF